MGSLPLKSVHCTPSLRGFPVQSKKAGVNIVKTRVTWLIDELFGERQSGQVNILSADVDRQRTAAKGRGHVAMRQMLNGTCRVGSSTAAPPRRRRGRSTPNWRHGASAKPGTAVPPESCPTGRRSREGPRRPHTPGPKERDRQVRRPPKRRCSFVAQPVEG